MKQIRLLILTQYFPPETGAPQNRLFELALRLKASGIHVEVLTAMPNYPLNEIYPGYEIKELFTNRYQKFRCTEHPSLSQRVKKLYRDCATIFRSFVLPTSTEKLCLLLILFFVNPRHYFWGTLRCRFPKN
jgi:hypothetical protein